VFIDESIYDHAKDKKKPHKDDDKSHKPNGAGRRNKLVKSHNATANNIDAVGHESVLIHIDYSHMIYSHDFSQCSPSSVS
jgi:hypothetical protein